MHGFDLAQRAKASTRCVVECLDKVGRLKWRETFQNLVVTEGLNTLLGRTFDAVGADVNWYVGLSGPGTGTVAVNSASAAVTGTGTGFSAELDDAPIADIIIVGAGAAGADKKTTVSARSSTTAPTLSANADTTSPEPPTPPSPWRATS